jgi:hypothetical protein
MCLTDATNLIPHPLSKQQKAVLRALKKKIQVRKRELQLQIGDLDRGLKKIEKNLKR